jgi:WD40 repeat protein
VRILESPNTEAWSVAYSPDGEHIVSGFADGTIRIWDTATGMQQHTLNGHEGRVRSVAFSPNSQLVASGSDDCTVRLWDITTGTQQYVMNGHETYLEHVSFSSDGQDIVSTSNGWMRIWDARTGMQRYIIGREDASYAVLSPNDQYIASGSLDDTIRKWHTSMGMLQHGLHGYNQSFAFSPNSQYVASGSGVHGGVDVWDIATDIRQHFIIDDDRSRVQSVTFSPDGQRVACGSDSTIYILDVKMGTQQYVLNGHEDDVCSVAFSPAGRHIVSASKDSTVRVWDTTTDAQHRSTSGPKGGITSLKFWSHGRYVVSGSIGDMVQVWDTITGMRLVSSHNEHDPRSVAFSPNGQLIAFAFGHHEHDHTVQVWNADMGTQQLVMHGHKDTVRCMAFSPNSQLVVSGSNDRTVRAWDTTTGTQQIALDGHRKLVNSVAFSPDGLRIVSASDDYTVRVWDARTGTQQYCLTGHRGRVLSAVFSPDGRYIASGSHDRTLRVWDSSTGAQRHIMTNDDRVNFVAFTTSGQHIVSGSSSRRHVRVWDTTTGTPDQSVVGHEGAVYSIVFSHDGQYVTAICSKSILTDSDEPFHYTKPSLHGGLALVWDASTGASIITYGLNDEKIVASAFTQQRPAMVFSLDMETGWISCMDLPGVPKRLCWLPKERRGRQIAAWGEKVCIGTPSGMVTILDFSNVVSL